ncbi:MAG: energy transducer TonB [Nitrospirae bacterium]|nr:energy transducer TonB [Nitrospirota bacterium]
MFDEIYREGEGFSLKRWITSLILAAIFYLILFFVFSTVKSTTVQKKELKKVDVAFVEEVEKKPPPPKPAAPAIPKDVKVVQVDEPVVQKELAPPPDIPDTAPKEADPSKDKGVAVYGAYNSKNVAPPGGSEQPEIKPVQLPENAVPPQPLADNATPEYPSEAKKQGLTGVVMLKVIIDTNGNVIKVEVLRGEEPFKSAAVKAVKKWKYTPAYYNNKPITVYRIIKIPFKLVT